MEAFADVRRSKLFAATSKTEMSLSSLTTVAAWGGGLLGSLEAFDGADGTVVAGGVVEVISALGGSRPGAEKNFDGLLAAC